MEWFYDSTTAKLYYIHNATGMPPESLEFEAVTAKGTPRNQQLHLHSRREQTQTTLSALVRYSHDLAELMAMLVAACSRSATELQWNTIEADCQHQRARYDPP